MHIGVLSDPDSFHTQKWVTALQQAGAKVTVFSFSQSRIPGIACVHIPPSYAINGKWTYASFLYSGDLLRHELTRHGVDIIQAINVTPYGVWGARSGFRPLINMAMGADILEYPPTLEESVIPMSRFWSSADTEANLGILSKGIHQLKWRIFRGRVQEALNASDLIMGDNIRLLTAMKDWFSVPAHKLSLNRWGVDESLFEANATELRHLKERFGVRPWQKLVLSARGLKPVYQADIILDAFEMLIKRGVRDLKFVMLASNYEIPPSIEKKAQFLESHFPNFTMIRELLPRHTVCQLWRITDAFINIPAYDGFSNALCEGRYAGAIPIVNDIPAHREVIKHNHNGWIVDPLTPHHLADGILNVMEQGDALKAKFGKANREWTLKHAHLHTNIEAFLHEAEQVLRRYRKNHSPKSKSYHHSR
ncbi:glycosyltransferase [Pontibacter sp. G13]|uniref:glycosyltransferase n=1 Tax=Pontibacter sp. G13 TaxID=3074898 RepID=UPI00288ABBC5|nr:glycosyltransferase [Pontibacter sp. G13]WNJ21343.1 glycosyltransferase [Pontibacter sp. G13]